ncbi:uncharacterized protein LOC142175839 [Nicotiana tabacum]|uniref:Uncharacterized protein LOC142175839 n=1 Tax=Nicotiana tabacum TaxID=4097 RepID=A0AC58TP02_TOBAC
MLHEQELHNLDDDDDEIEEGDDSSLLPLKLQKRGRIQTMSSSCGSTGKTKGPMDCYFSQKPGDMGGKNGNPQIDAKAILRDRAVAMFARWMYDAGQYGPGMKPPTYHEVRGPYLKKEVEETNKIVEEHKVEWNNLFLESVDASNSSADSTKMYSLFKSTINSIGAENVVQVVTDNASENVKAEKVFNQAIRVHSYIVQRPLLLNMMKRFTKQRSLMKPAKTRFATAFLTLHRMYEQKSNLKKLFVYTNNAYGREVRGRESADIMLSTTLWNNVIHRPLHAARLVLNPELFYDNEERIIGDEELWSGYIECIEKLIPEESVQDKITEQFSTYRNAEQLLGKNMAIRQRKMKSPVEWWKQYGHSTPELQKFAIKRRYNARNVLDPIRLDNIDDANEWLTGVPKDHADEEVFEETFDFTRGDVAEARGIGERIYDLRVVPQLQAHSGREKKQLLCP